MSLNNMNTLYIYYNTLNEKIKYMKYYIKRMFKHILIEIDL